jgi:prepilin-type N-terminal cleavage/methylation domain-containing protein
MNRCRQHGFTLLEVMLALGLTALILVALGMAIDFHLRVLDAGRAHVEEAQLARVLLRRIADDLRGTVPYDSQNSAGTSGGTGMQDTLGGTGTLGSIGDSVTQGTSNTSDTSNASGTTLSTTPQATPGIYGYASAIQIDVSRLPMPYQLQTQCALGTEGLQATSLSDAKTVCYYVGSTQGTGSTMGFQGGDATAARQGTAGGLPAAASGDQGLLRVEQDRAAAQFQAEHGGVSSSALSPTLLAPEVAGIEFAYCDGTQWLDVWDTTQNGGLPVAVRVTLYITPARPQRNGSSWLNGLTGSSSAQEANLAYYLLVQIPAAQAVQSSGSPDSGSSSGDSSKSESGGSASGKSGGSGKSSGSGGGSSTGSGGGSGGTSGGAGGGAGRGGGSGTGGGTGRGGGGGTGGGSGGGGGRK